MDALQHAADDGNLHLGEHAGLVGQPTMPAASGFAEFLLDADPYPLTHHFRISVSGNRQGQRTIAMHTMIRRWRTGRLPQGGNSP